MANLLKAAGTAAAFASTGSEPSSVAGPKTPCCANQCEAPLVKMYSVDAPHGFCGESCMDPKKFDLYHKFEANLTVAEENDIHPCARLRTPSNTKHYTDYFDTVTHGVPGLLSVTLDLYAPNDLPDHSCCATPLPFNLNCFGKPQSLKLAGTGPFCCPKGATEETPCPKGWEEQVEAVAPAAAAAAVEQALTSNIEKDGNTPCCDKECPEGSVKMFSTDAAHGFCGEACMDPKKFDLYHKFEANLTVAKEGDLHPCSRQLTPSNTAHYTKYSSTVTHGVPGLLSVTLDLYAPDSMPDTSCCYTPLVPSLHCTGIPTAPTELRFLGTGPFCCPRGATEQAPCAKAETSEVFNPAQAVLAPALLKKETKQEPCCNKKCQAPLVKMFSTDAGHGFCGEACMDPEKFSTYKKFEANLTVAKDGDDHPCSEQWTPDNSRQYTDYFSTVTHGDPFGILSVTLDLYAPNNMPDHSCCVTPLVPQAAALCFGIPGKGKATLIAGTGPYCCPATGTPENPCGSAEIVV